MTISHYDYSAVVRCSDNLEEGSTNICKYLQIVQKYLSSHVVGGSISWKGRSCGMVLFENYFIGFKKYYPLEIFRSFRGRFPQYMLIFSDFPKMSTRRGQSSKTLTLIKPEYFRPYGRLFMVSIGISTSLRVK